jgi:hypothetical protein
MRDIVDREADQRFAHTLSAHVDADTDPPDERRRGRSGASFGAAVDPLSLSERARAPSTARQRTGRQNRRLRRALGAVAVLLVTALIGGLLAFQQRRTAQEQRATAEREERQAARRR